MSEKVAEVKDVTGLAVAHDVSPVPPAPLPAGLLRRDDGIFFDITVAAPVFLAAVHHVFLTQAYFSGLDYAVFSRALYNTGPPLQPALPGETLVRLAANVLPFAEARRALYKLVKINHGVAEYYFEPMLAEEDGLPVKLDFDEFVADLWSKGVRFGIDARAVKAIIDSGKAERIAVARPLEPAPGRDAQIVEVASDIHRDDAPRERSDGRLDLLSFKNRFPQVRKNARLLKKVPFVNGAPGYDLSGAVLLPEPPLDIALTAMAGDGTVVEVQREGEFLVALQDGFVNVDSASGKLAIGSSIISRDGVSSRTTGNLKLRAAYEEYGEVQEQRTVDGSDITIHGHVFGHLHSHGGDIILRGNLVGGTAMNNLGNIRVDGVASGAVVQTAEGEVRMQRAESCVITGTKVIIDFASNCDIVADEVVIEMAEGCAVAGRSVEIGSCGPRKQVEMLVFCVVPDISVFDRKIAEAETRAADFAKAVIKRQQEVETIGNRPEVRNYLTLAGQIRRQELVLQPAQAAGYQKLANAVAPALKEVGRLRLEIKQMEIQQVQLRELAVTTAQEKQASAGRSRCKIDMITGDTLVRTMNATGGKVYAKPPRDIKARLRSVSSGIDVIFSGAAGELEWTYLPPQS